MEWKWKWKWSIEIVTKFWGISSRSVSRGRNGNVLEEFCRFRMISKNSIET